MNRNTAWASIGQAVELLTDKYSEASIAVEFRKGNFIITMRECDKVLEHSISEYIFLYNNATFDAVSFTCQELSDRWEHKRPKFVVVYGPPPPDQVFALRCNKDERLSGNYRITGAVVCPIQRKKTLTLEAEFEDHES